MQRRFYHLAYTLISNVHDADDAVSETNLRIYSNIHSFVGDYDERVFENWAYVICRNACYQKIQKNRRQMHYVDTNDLDDRLSDEKLPVDMMISREVKENLKNEIRKLNPMDAKLIFYRYFHEVDCQTLSEVFDLSYDAVRNHMYDSRVKLRNTHFFKTLSSSE